MLAGFRRRASARNVAAPRGRVRGPTRAARETSRFSLSWMAVCFFCDLGPEAMSFMRACAAGQSRAWRWQVHLPMARQDGNGRGSQGGGVYDT